MRHVVNACMVGSPGTWKISGQINVKWQKNEGLMKKFEANPKPWSELQKRNCFQIYSNSNIIIIKAKLSSTAQHLGLEGLSELNVTLQLFTIQRGFPATLNFAQSMHGEPAFFSAQHEIVLSQENVKRDELLVDWPQSSRYASV